MSSAITTYTGKHFDPLHPDPQAILIEDIAHALSLLCRGNGHVQSFWSVAQHCLCCAEEASARNLPDRMVLACLLHDAGECYLSDIPRPFKQALPQYRKSEDALLELIYTKFLGSPLSPQEQSLLQEIDDAMLWFDLSLLLHETPSQPKPVLHIDLDYSFRPFQEVERAYLDVFYRHSGTPGPAAPLPCRRKP